MLNLNINRITSDETANIFPEIPTKWTHKKVMNFIALAQIKE